MRTAFQILTAFCMIMTAIIVANLITSRGMPTVEILFSIFYLIASGALGFIYWSILRRGNIDD